MDPATAKDTRKTLTSTLREAHLGTARGLLSIGGNEFLAITHPTGTRAFPTGPAAPNLYMSTKTFYEKSVISSRGKHLTPYSPWAHRNRPKESQSNTVGRRYGNPIAGEKYKGASQIQMSTPLYSSNWQTTNQAFFSAYRISKVTGLQNMGISSRVAKEAHSKTMNF